MNSKCEYESRCLSNTKCYKCHNYTLLKLPEDKYKKQMQRKAKKDLDKAKSKYNDTDKSWRSLEQEVASKINNIPTIQEARRSRMSGALEFEKGDIVDTVLHPECKERKGTKLKSGEKSMSIKKEWLEKAKDECKDTDKTMCLPFRFKGDENIYVILDFDDLAALTTSLKAYMIENEILTKELNRK